MKKLASTILAVGILLTTPLLAQIDKDELKKWEGRKYSMFIHWGLYSVPAGVWNDKEISYGYSEQIQSHAGIYSDVYAGIAERFNPDKWDAREVAKLAKDAGMKSIVFTTKHHDGFCMFDTKTTDYNIVKATPYKRDVLKELADACQEEGLKLGFYYSNIDWNYPPAYPISSHNSDPVPAEHFEFTKVQLTELLSNYGEISELWFDMGSYTLEQSIELKKLVRKLQPNCMNGGRIGNGQGDFMVMGDNQEPDYIIGVPWQSPASFFPETWSYRSWQDRGSEDAKYLEKLKSLVNVCARGGNYLLNIGPRGDGSVVEFERDILLRIGKWLEKNGESIYETSADPFHKKFEWGAVTCNSNNIYLHITDVPGDRKITLPSFGGSISNVSILGENVKCKYSKTKDNFIVQLPNTVDGKDVYVVNIKFKNGFKTTPLNIIAESDDTKLTPYNAFNYYSHSGVDYNSMYQSTIKQIWTLIPQQSKKVTPVLTYTAQEAGKTLNLELGTKKQTVTLDQTNKTALDNDISSIQWGTIYMQDARKSSLMREQGDITEIDLTKEWGGYAWKPTNYKNNKVYTLSGSTFKAYNTAQEIYSPKAQKVLIEVTSGEGVIVALNGEVLVNHGNLERSKTKKDIVMLDLKEGKNMLYVMFYADQYNKDFDFGIAYNIPQQVYAKELPQIQLSKGKYFPVSWQTVNALSIHETMNTPNITLKFK